MSAVAVIRYLLANDATLTAQVPATRIMAGVLPLATALPAISVVEISAVDRNTVAMNESARMVTSRVQVTVKATTYPQAKQLIELVRKACPHTTGTVAGVAVKAVLPEATGPDIEDLEVGSRDQSRDFVVQWAAQN